MYLISYDISVDKVRTKLAKVLEDYGKRVQYSVFECDLTNKQYKHLYKQMLEIVNHDPDGSVRIYKLCKYCTEHISTIGINNYQTNKLDEKVFII